MAVDLPNSETALTPLKKCPSCGDEWITDQTEVTCIATGEKTFLVTIDEEPYDEDLPYVQNPCSRGRHSLDKTYYRRVRPDGRIESGCGACRKELNKQAVLRYKARQRTSKN